MEELSAISPLPRAGTADRHIQSRDGKTDYVKSKFFLIL
jgi:hypothetical protein